MPYIRAEAQKRGLDPKAVLAVAKMEGLSGRVGDGGHAFGPFQMNDAGGVLTGRPGNHRAYAESKAGINDALAAMQRVAGGMRGKAAVSNIVSRYERPAAPGKEIAGALAAYGGSLGSSGAAGFVGGGGGRPPQVSGLSQGGGADFKQQMAAYFAQTANAAAAGQAPDSSALMQLAQARQQSEATQQLGAKAMSVQVDHSDPVSPHAGTAVQLAQKYVGTKYLWGGTSPNTGFDCSGFVQWVYKQQGVNLPRTTYEQIKVGKAVNRQGLRPGDVVFFSKSGDVHHEGMYVGHNQFIHAPHTGDVVKISSLNDPYYASQFAGGRRMK